MHKGSRFWILILLTITFIRPVMAESPKTEIFEYKFQAGQTLVYLISVHGTVEVETPLGSEANPLHVEMEIRQKIEKVKGDRADISMLVASAKVFNGSESAALPEEGQRFTLVMDKYGNIEYKSGAGSWKGSEFAQLVFPRRPLAVGNFWIQETEIDHAGIPTKTRTRYIFSGHEKLGNRECATFYPELILQGTENNPSEPNANSKGKIYFSRDLGQVVKAVVLSTFSFLMPIDVAKKQFARTKTSLHTEMRLVAD